MPTKYAFEQIIMKLEEIVKLYKNSPFRFNKYKLYLSNGKVIEFSFKPQNIAHLLGINITSLKASRILLSNTAFEMIEELIDRYTAIYQKMANGEACYKDIFSPFIKEKLAFFEKVFRFNSHDILGICHYVPARSYINGEPNNYGCEYYIIFDDGDNYPYFLGLKKDQNSRFYVPSSLISSFEEEKSYKLFGEITANQEVMLVNNVLRTNTGDKFYITNAEKLSLVQKLSELARTYNFHMIVDSDYIHTLKK